VSSLSGAFGAAKVVPRWCEKNRTHGKKKAGRQVSHGTSQNSTWFNFRKKEAGKHRKNAGGGGKKKFAVKQGIRINSVLERHPEKWMGRLGEKRSLDRRHSKNSNLNRPSKKEHKFQPLAARGKGEPENCTVQLNRNPNMFG